eukprot:Gb_05886 [translate_table: standard]
MNSQDFCNTNPLSRPRTGSSLPVQNVQELAGKHLQDVPQRYIRSVEDRPSPDFTSAPHHLQIPVIDTKKLLEEEEEEMGKLHMACQHWGFFQLINHGVPHFLMDKMKSSAREFFGRPLEEKQRYVAEAGDLEGYGQAFVVSEDQKLDWGDMLYLLVKPSTAINMRRWPSKPENFRETLEGYSVEIQKVAVYLLSVMAQNLGLQPHYFNEMFGEAVQGVRFNYYPPCPRPELVLGLSPHSDGGGITLLLQDDAVEGLNIRKDDSWIPVKPLPNAFVVNIGDSLEIMSNGRYESIEHRAITNRDSERLSIATFFIPGYETTLAPSPDLIDEEHPRLYKSMKTTEYFAHYFRNKLRGKASLEFAKI